MKTALKFSLLCNAALALTLAWQLVPDHAEPIRPSAAGSSPPEAPNSTSPTPFEWSQLEAPDYPTYVANLRAIRCPEATLRDIVAADVGAVFARERAGGTHRDPADAERWSQAAEARLVARLMGDPEETNAVTPAQVAGPAKPQLPVAFQTAALARLNLEPEQREAIAQLACQFIDDIGGTNQDPADPGYRTRWEAAQAKSDAFMLGALGRKGLIDLDQAMPPVEPEAP